MLVRHGETPTTGKCLPGRAPGLHLSETGKAQALAVAERLAALPRIDALYTSPLERTRETSRPTADARRMKVAVERGLIEADVGDWTGRELKEVRKHPDWKIVHQFPSGFRFPGGESFVEMQSRALAAVERLRAAHPGQTVVAFSHADIIKAVVAHAVGTHLDLFQRLVISPCSVTAIAYGSTGPTVLCVNSVGDLVALKPS
ncbi:MAG: MSMEG_4193 family putative phosphomutase [Acidimicrobiales bacterium]